MLSGYLQALASSFVMGFASLFPLSVFKLAGEPACPMCIYAGVLLAILYSFSSVIGEVPPRLVMKKMREEHSFLFYVIILTLAVGVPIVKGGASLPWPSCISIILGALIVLFSWKPPLGKVFEELRKKSASAPAEGILVGIAQGFSFLGIPPVALTYAVLMFTGSERRREMRLVLMALSVYYVILMFAAPSPCIHSALRIAVYLVSSFAGAAVSINLLLRASGTRWFSVFYGLVAVANGLILWG